MVDSKDMMRLVRYISSDVGLRNIDNYAVVRFGEILAKYYPKMTFENVREAFEMCVMGGLDQCLPKDRDGNPDRNHYQSFSLEYIGKVLRAYEMKMTEERRAVLLSRPKEVLMLPDAEKDRLRGKWQEHFVAVFAIYKHKGVLKIDNCTINVYRELEKRRKVDGYDISREDRERAKKKLLMQAREGKISDVMADYLNGVSECYDINLLAVLYAKRRAVKEAFDEMINNDEVL